MSTSITACPSMTELTSTMQASVLLQASTAVDAMTMEVERCRNLQVAVDRLRGRNAAVGLPADAARLRDALAHHLALDEVFAADPASLAGNLADAQMLAGNLEQGGVDVQAQLSYPVLVRSTHAGATSEPLLLSPEIKPRRMEATPDVMICLSR